MASLWWMTSLESEGVTYGDWNRVQQKKQQIAEELTRRGFSSVRVTDFEIAASKDGTYLSIAHLSHPSPNKWWEIIMCSGESAAQAKNIVQQASNAVRFTW